MGNEYLTISEIEKLTGIPNSNIRRYIANFDSFFIAKGGSRVKKYESAAVDVLKRIKSLYDNGMDTHEIHNVLIKEFPLVVNGEEQGEKGQAPAVPTLATGEEVTKIGEDIAAIKIALDEQKQFNQALLQANQALLQKMDQDRVFFEQKFEELKYDREFVYSLRESMQQRKLEAAAAQEPTVTAANEEVVNAGEQVTNGEEQATVKASEEVTKASKEAAPSQEKPKKKGLLAWLFGE